MKLLKKFWPRWLNAKTTMKTLILTGYKSQIAKELLMLALQRESNLRVLKCGRRPDADFQVDFSSYRQTREFIKWMRSIQPDYLFLNHGILPGKRLAETPDTVINKSLRINLVSFAMTIEILPEIDDLRTVVMSSISGKAGSFDTLYASCKAGVDVAIKKVAASLPPNARLNAVSPGIIADARMTTARKDIDVLEVKRKQTPTQCFTTSRDVARLVGYLLFEAGNMQGENININGGMYIP